MNGDERWINYFRKALAQAEKDLADFNEAVAKYQLRIWHRDVYGERDHTEENRKALEASVEEYRAALRDE